MNLRVDDGVSGGTPRGDASRQGRPSTRPPSPVGFGLVTTRRSRATPYPPPRPGAILLYREGLLNARAPWVDRIGTKSSSSKFLVSYSTLEPLLPAVNCANKAVRDVRAPRETHFHDTHPSPRRGLAVEMAQFVGKPLPDFSVKPLRGGELGAKTSLKGLAAGRPLVRSRRVRPKQKRGALRPSLPPRAFSDIGRGNTQHTQVIHFYNSG